MRVKLSAVSFFLVVLAAAPAAADYYYAVSTGEKHFTGRESRAYRATRASMGRCVTELDPALCREVSLEHIGGRWESDVVGRKGFYASDRDRLGRAERRALAACRADPEFVNCQLRTVPRPEPTGSESDERPTGLDSIFDELLRN